jgi:hypothetical protein
MGEHMAMGVHISVRRGSWLEQSITDGTMVAVMDGSYIKELYQPYALQRLFLNVVMDVVEWSDPFQKRCWLQMHIEGSHWA